MSPASDHSSSAPDLALATIDHFTLGVRPEYVRLTDADAPGSLPGVVTAAQDIGTYWLVTAQVGDSLLRARLSPEQVIPRVGDHVWMSVVGTHTCYYVNEELVT